ncbi:hypothetical protein HPP92_018256 [Vanilla planifolia]|uniref:Uncharacterized protein n=1 Tax=Vanilla planifolia TaxID=51239 RepID=A0A835QCM0_VANPL|nr:hypothetical protein HPP92_018256 [Vanilla planifolia]
MDDRHSMEFLLSRLDLIDIRVSDGPSLKDGTFALFVRLTNIVLVLLQLRQLEEKQREPENYFTADLRARGKPMPSSMDDARLKRNLMNRLRLLETRIRQLSQELEKGGESAGASSSSPSMKQKQIVPSGGGRVVGGAWRAGAEIFHGHWPKKKVRAVSMLKRVLGCICCTDDDNCCLNSPSSGDCKGQGRHAGCYH